MNPPEPRTEPAAGAERWPELDGIRCLAVLGVLAVHFAPGSLHGPWGDWGVRTFFVLSGFLITFILLGSRERIDAARLATGAAIGQFFSRRIVRLWPLYFAVVAVTWAFDVGASREMLPWNVSFTTNYYITSHGVWPGLNSHLWTLAVEQQFYLFWPFVVLCASRRAGLLSLAIVVVLAPVTRGAELTGLAALAPEPNYPAAPLLPMNSDSLAWGALLAFAYRYRPDALARCSQAAGLAAVALFFAHYLLFRLGPPRFEAPLLHAWSASVLAVAGVLLVGHCIGPGGSPLRRFLRLRPMVYLGTISYGIYLLHNYAHWVGPALLRRLHGRNYFSTETAHVVYYTLLSIALAAASWHFMERPLQQLRRRIASPGR
ncbi:MAG: acyltransferase [Verrucomicrobia bacterium]|nr:acyltransferase [Verrucomicrobiota bacterium]